MIKNILSPSYIVTVGIVWGFLHGNNVCESSVRWRQGKWKCRYVIVTDRFYIALFSVVEQPHCVLDACDSE